MLGVPLAMGSHVLSIGQVAAHLQSENRTAAPRELGPLITPTACKCSLGGVAAGEAGRGGAGQLGYR